MLFTCLRLKPRDVICCAYYSTGGTRAGISWTAEALKGLNPLRGRLQLIGRVQRPHLFSALIFISAISGSDRLRGLNPLRGPVQRPHLPQRNQRFRSGV